MKGFETRSRAILLRRARQWRATCKTRRRCGCVYPAAGAAVGDWCARRAAAASLPRSNAAKIRCNVALAFLDGEFEGSFARTATQRVSFETAAARAACERRRYLSLAATSALLSTRKRVVSRCPLHEERIKAVRPLITEIRKIERSCSVNAVLKIISKGCSTRYSSPPRLRRSPRENEWFQDVLSMRSVSRRCNH